MREELKKLTNKTLVEKWLVTNGYPKQGKAFTDELSEWEEYVNKPKVKEVEPIFSFDMDD